MLFIAVGLVVRAAAVPHDTPLSDWAALVCTTNDNDDDDDDDDDDTSRCASTTTTTLSPMSSRSLSDAVPVDIRVGGLRIDELFLRTR